jgi:hypothetical protein
MADSNENRPWYERALDPSEKHSWYIWILVAMWHVSWDMSNERSVSGAAFGKDRVDRTEPWLFRNFAWRILAMFTLFGVMMLFVFAGWIVNLFR